MSDDEFWEKEPHQEPVPELGPMPSGQEILATVMTMLVDGAAGTTYASSADEDDGEAGDEGADTESDEDDYAEYDGEPLSEEEIVEDPEALRRAQEIVDRIQEPSVGDVLADEASEADFTEQADPTEQAGAAFPTPVTGVAPGLSDNDRLSAMASGGGGGVGIALAVIGGLFVIMLVLFMLLKG